MIRKIVKPFIQVIYQHLIEWKCHPLILGLLLIPKGQLLSQDISLDLEGGLKLGTVTSSDPAPGTIRFNENNFEGWNGFAWVRLGGFVVVGEVVDFDGNQYPTVRIGDQVWMAQNLRVKHYNDGADMQIQSGQYIINYGAPGTLHYPNDDVGTLPVYGGLYDFYCIETNKICPVGWHVPSKDEWQAMVDYLGGNEIAGVPLKESGSMHWTSENQGSNESGFSARGAGRWHETPQGPTGFPYEAFLWTRTSINLPYFRYIFSSGNSISEAQASSKLRGCSVRCVQNN